MLNMDMLLSIIAIVTAVGSVFIAIGYFKGKLQHNSEATTAQGEEIKTLAAKGDLASVASRGDEQLAAAIKRSDEMLAIMTKRAEEDRNTGAMQYKEFHSLLRGHAERISALETHQNVLMKSLDEIKNDIKGGFKDLQNELKELRKHA